MEIAHRHQHISRPDVYGFVIQFLARGDFEFIQLLSRTASSARVFFRSDEYREKEKREDDARNSCDWFRDQDYQGEQEKCQMEYSEAMWNVKLYSHTV